MSKCDIKSMGLTEGRTEGRTLFLSGLNDGATETEDGVERLTLTKVSRNREL